MLYIKSPQSLIGNVIHSFKKDEDLDKWFPDYLSQSLIGNVIHRMSFLYDKDGNVSIPHR